MIALAVLDLVLLLVVAVLAWKLVDRSDPAVPKKAPRLKEPKERIVTASYGWDASMRARFRARVIGGSEAWQVVIDRQIVGNAWEENDERTRMCQPSSVDAGSGRWWFNEADAIAAGNRMLDQIEAPAPGRVI